MSEQTKLKPDHIREAFEAAPGKALLREELHSALDAAGFDVSGQKEYIGSVVRYLVNAGYLAKAALGSTVQYSRTAKPQGRPHRLPVGEANRRRQERRRLKDLAKRAAAVPRERRRDANTVARPKKVPPVPAVVVAETVEQFRRRGGRVERLPTHWEQMERAA